MTVRAPKRGGGYETAGVACSSEPCPLEEKTSSSEGTSGSGALSRRSSSPSSRPKSRCRHAACQNAARLPVMRRDAVARRVHAVHDRGQRPGREVLGQAGQRAARPRRDRQGRRHVGVHGAEHRAVEQVDGGPDRDLGAPADHRGAEELGVVVGHAEHALVQRLLGRPHARRGGAGERAAQRPGQLEGHVRTVTGRAGVGTRHHGPGGAAPARPRAGREPHRVLAVAGRPAAVLPPLLPPLAGRARARTRGGAGHLRRQPPLVPGPVRHRHAGAAADLLRGQAGAVPLPRLRLVPELAGRLPGQARRRRPGHDRDGRRPFSPAATRS